MEKDFVNTPVSSFRTQRTNPEASRVTCDDPPAVLDSRAIFGDKREIDIRHGGQLYKLRITRYGKLILNK